MLYNDEIKKVFNLLKENNLNPKDFYINNESTGKHVTVSKEYFRIIKEENNKVEPVRKYKIYCHTRKQDGISYIEDIFSQAESHNLEPEVLLSIFESNDNKIYCCYDTIVNTIGRMIFHCTLNSEDFDIIYYDNGKEIHTYYDTNGYICRWPIGYFTYLDTNNNQ